MRMWKQARTVVEVLIAVLVLAAWNSEAQDHPAAGHGAPAVELDEVVVTAARIREYVENHPQQVSVMTRDQILEGSYTDLNQVLNAMPGVEAKKSGSGFGSRISIRGSGGGNILVLINGRPANSSQYGGVDLDSIPLDTVARVDVFKPPVPVWLGPGGSSGAINIVLADQSTQKKATSKNTRIGITGGSFGQAGVSVSRLMPLQAQQLRLTAAANHTDGRRTNSDRNSGSLSFQWDLPSSGTTTYDLNGRYYQSEQGSPGPVYNLTPDARQSYQKGSLDFRVKGLCGQTGDYDLKTYLDVTRLRDESQSGFVSTLDALVFGIKNDTSWSAADDTWSVRLSGHLAEDRIEHTLSGDHNREQASVGLQGDRTIAAMTASLGARCDYTSDFHFQPAVNAGLSIPFTPRSTAKINAGYAVNVPTYSQLYQPSHGSIDQVRGNPGLDVESVRTLSAGFNHGFAKDRTLEITVFREETDDKIVYQQDMDLIMRPVNIDGAYRQGIETVANWKLTSSADMDVSYLWQQGRNRETDTELTYTPEHKFKVTLNWTWPTKTRTETTVTSASGYFSDLENTAEKKVDGNTTVDLKLIQPVGFQRCRTELFVYFENLLDETYDVHYGYPDDGFRVTAGVNIDF
jgi:vitamin B12 transporter